MEILNKLHREISSRYGESLEKEVVFGGKCVRFGKDDHGWIYANEWEYKGNAYQEITFGSWRAGDKNELKSWDKELYKDKNFNKAYKKKTKEAKAKIELDTQKRQRDCREKWQPIYNKCKPCLEHEYLEFKGVKASSNLRVDHNGVLMVPAYNINGFTGLQRIWKDPETQKFVKKYTYGIEIQGSILPLTSPKGKDFGYVAEGYATASTIQKLYPDVPVFVCFSANNIGPAIETIRLRYPDMKLCIAADNDHATKTPINNPGLFYARKAAKRYSATVYRSPKFSVLNADWTDFNDLAQFESNDLAIEQLHVDMDAFSFIEPLGHNDGTYFYISSENQQIVPLSWNAHTKGGLRRLISGDSYWLKNYGFEVDDEALRISWDNAGSDLMGRCHTKGIFDPSLVRGLGVWLDGKGYVINDGEKVFNPNENSKFKYQKTIPIDYSIINNPDCDNMLHLLEAFKNLEYKNKNDYFYLASWYVQAQIFSVLPWRFHIWVTGSAGTGKSTVLKWIKRLSMNSILTNNTSAAGVRQTVKSNAVSIIYDEAEPTTPRTKDVIELAREMSTNGEYEALRGTVSGNAINHNTQCVFCFGSIQVHQLKSADQSRIFMVELNTVKDQKETVFADISERFDFFARDKNEIFTIIYQNIDNILWNMYYCKKLLKVESKLEARLADQLSVAMACFFVYFGQRKMERSDFDTIVKSFGLVDSEYANQNKEKEHDSCYDALMGTIINNYRQITVAEAIHNIEYKSPDSDEYERDLGTYGLKYFRNDRLLFVQSKNGNMKGKIKDYPDLTRVLKRDKSILVRESDRVSITQMGYVRGIRIKVKGE